MSRLKQEIKSSLQKIEQINDLKTRAHFIFPKKFIGFKGHFPNKPILPGVCKILASLLVLEELKQKNLRLTEIIQAKFFAPVSFNQALTFDLEEQPASNTESTLKIRISSDDKKIAQLQLRVNLLEK